MITNKKIKYFFLLPIFFLITGLCPVPDPSPDYDIIGVYPSQDVAIQTLKDMYPDVSYDIQVSPFGSEYDAAMCGHPTTGIKQFFFYCPGDVPCECLNDEIYSLNEAYVQVLLATVCGLVLILGMKQ